MSAQRENSSGNFHGPRGAPERAGCNHPNAASDPEAETRQALLHVTLARPRCDGGNCSNFSRAQIVQRKQGIRCVVFVRAVRFADGMHRNESHCRMKPQSAAGRLDLCQAQSRSANPGRPCGPRVCRPTERSAAP